MGRAGLQSKGDSTTSLGFAAALPNLLNRVYFHIFPGSFQKIAVVTTPTLLAHATQAAPLEFDAGRFHIEDQLVDFLYDAGGLRILESLGVQPCTKAEPGESGFGFTGFPFHCYSSLVIVYLLIWYTPQKAR